MPVILTIGHNRFLVKSVKSATDVIRALEGSMPMERNWCDQTHRDVYKPETRERDLTIKMEVIDKAQIQLPKPPRKPQTERLLTERKEPPINFNFG